MLCITGCFLHGSSRFIKERPAVYDFMHPSSFGYILAYLSSTFFPFPFSFRATFSTFFFSTKQGRTALVKS